MNLIEVRDTTMTVKVMVDRSKLSLDEMRAVYRQLVGDDSALTDEDITEQVGSCTSKAHYENKTVDAKMFIYEHDGFAYDLAKKIYGWLGKRGLGLKDNEFDAQTGYMTNDDGDMFHGLAVKVVLDRADEVRATLTQHEYEV